MENTLPAGLIDGQVGDQFSFLGVQYQIAERGEATVLGGEGQLPKRFEPGEQFLYIDLAEVGGRGRLTAEIFDGQSIGFVGRILRHNQVVFPKAWDREKHKESGAVITCEGCGSSIDIRPLPEPAKTVACKYCGSIHSLYGDESSLLGKNERRDDLHLMIGSSGTLKGRSYEVIGRMVYEELELDDGMWGSAPTLCWEYLLLDQEGGFATVEVTDEGVVLVRKSDILPNLARLHMLKWGEAYSWNGRSYRMYEEGKSTLQYVDGALPWVARLGDVSRFKDFIDQPSLWKDDVSERLSLEWTEADDGNEETEIFIARDLDPTTLADAFDGSIHPVVKQRILRGHRVSPQVPRFGLMWLGLGILCFGISLITGLFPGKRLGSATIRTTSLPEVAVSQPFTVDDNELVRMVIQSDVNNSWLWSEIDLIDANSAKSLGFVTKEVSYYHGVEGGESWSEGSQNWDRVFQVPKGGTYQIKFQVAEASKRPVRATAAIYQKSFDPKYPKVFSIFLIVFGVVIHAWSGIGRPNLWPSED